MISSMSPLIHSRQRWPQCLDAQHITERCYHAKNFFVSIRDFDAEEDKYMAVSEIYRGDVKAKKANATIPWLKTNKKCRFVEWCPTGFKIGLFDEPLKILPDDDLEFCQRHTMMIGNNTAISRVLAQRISVKYDLMFGQRAFVHWFVSEGLEEAEFVRARENLRMLEKDYVAVLMEAETDDDECGSD